MTRSHFAGNKTFGSYLESLTAPVWLTEFTEKNIIEIESIEQVIDQGNENIIQINKQIKES